MPTRSSFQAKGTNFQLVGNKVGAFSFYQNNCLFLAGWTTVPSGISLALSDDDDDSDDDDQISDMEKFKALQEASHRQAHESDSESDSEDQDEDEEVTFALVGYHVFNLRKSLFFKLDWFCCNIGCIALFPRT